MNLKLTIKPTGRIALTLAMALICWVSGYLLGFSASMIVASFGGLTLAAVFLKSTALTGEMRLIIGPASFALSIVAVGSGPVFRTNPIVSYEMLAGFAAIVALLVLVSSRVRS